MEEGIGILLFDIIKHKLYIISIIVIIDIIITRGSL